MGKSSPVLFSILVAVTLGLTACSGAKLALPQVVQGDVETCSKLGFFGQKTSSRPKSYLDDLDLPGAELKNLNFELEEFKNHTGKLGDLEVQSINAGIESIEASNFRPLSSDDSGFTSNLLRQIRYNTDEIGVYKIDMKTLANSLSSKVWNSCSTLEKTYPPAQYELIY